jgi:hypothetical protein
MKIALLIDSHEYIESNCYQHQLFRTLSRAAEIIPITIGDISTGARIPEADRVLSVLKQRTLYRTVDDVARALNGREVHVYDQDPWEAFKDDSPYKGAYSIFASRLNLRSILNTSKWWSDFVSLKGLPSQFVRMWMLPDYCTTGKRWSHRKVDVGFCGQLHPHRKEFFSSLEGHGIRVAQVPPTGYAGYLTTLSDMRVFVHSERVTWKVDGAVLPANALWIKDIEAAARGCFSVRDYEPEALNYEASQIEIVRTYDPKVGPIDAARVIKEIASMSESEATALVNRSVDFIRSARGWMTVLDALE